MLGNNKNSFNHLKIHTQYSICEGALKIEDLKNYCKKNKVQSVGISDTSNLCGALEFAESLSKIGTQPIIGTQINFKYKEMIGLMPLFAMNNNIPYVSGSTGYSNDDLEKIKDMQSKNKVGVALCSNFSTGAILLAHLGKIASKYYFFLNHYITS